MRSLRGAIAELRARRGDQVGRIEVALAVPHGSRRPLSQRELLTAAVSWPALGDVKRDVFRDHLIDWIRIMALCGSWTDADPDPRATTRPTRARTCRMGGFRESTFKRCRRWWEDQGFVRVVRQGRTAEARAMSRAPVAQYEGNDAAVFVLCIPRHVPRKNVPGQPGAQPPPESGPPRGSVSRRETLPSPVDDAKTGQGTGLRPGCLLKPAFPRRAGTHPVLSKLSDKAIRWLWRPFQAWGWSVADWLWALEHRPDGTPHLKDPAGPRRPAGLARWRFSLWLGADGWPVASRSQRAAAARAVSAAARVRERAELGWPALVPLRPFPSPPLEA